MENANLTDEITEFASFKDENNLCKGKY